MKSTSTFSSATAIAILCAGLSACGGGSSESPATPSPAPAPSPPPPPPEPSARIDLVDPAPAEANTLTIGGCDGTYQNNEGVFKDVSQAAGFCYAVAQSPEDSIPSRVAGGIAVADIDADGRLDIYVTHGRDSIGRLFTLNDTFQFVNVTNGSGITVSNTNFSANFLDIDEDGDQDLITMTEDAPFIQFFANQGNRRFNDISHLVDVTMTKWTYSMAAGDMDLDGDLDLFFAHWDPENDQDRWEFLWRRNGPGVYEDVSPLAELEPFGIDPDAPEDEESSFTPIFADINDDKFPDLVLASDWSTSQYLANNAGLGFVDETLQQVVSDRAGMGAAVADYDNDGDLDWFVSAIGNPREEILTISLFDGNRMYNNDGDGNFLNFTDFAGVRQGYWAWGSCFADFNNDGFEDLYVVNGYNGWDEAQAISGNFEQFNETPALLYINQQDGTFENNAFELGADHRGMGRGLVCYDYDRDGDVDILVANSGASPTLYRNDSDAIEQYFINVRLQGLPQNPQAVGARIYLTTASTSQMRELQLGNHYVSQNPVEAHFGLGGEETIQELRIVWPGNSTDDTVIDDLPINKFITVYHPDYED